jgi:hypothetical protein
VPSSDLGFILLLQSLEQLMCDAIAIPTWSRSRTSRNLSGIHPDLSLKMFNDVILCLGQDVSGPFSWISLLCVLITFSIEEEALVIFKLSFIYLIDKIPKIRSYIDNTKAELGDNKENIGLPELMRRLHMIAKNLPVEFRNHLWVERIFLNLFENLLF